MSMLGNKPQVFVPYTTSTAAVIGFTNKTGSPLYGDLARLTDLAGEAVGGLWEPIPVQISREIPKHFLYMSHEIVSDEETWELLKPYVEHDVEAIPLLDKDGNRYYFWNILYRQEGIFDLESSQYYRDTYTNQIRDVFRFEFHQEKLEGHYIFRLPELPESPYATDAFKALVERFELKNIAFHSANLLP